MDPPNVLWFLGAFAIAFGVYAVVATVPDDQNGLWRLVAAVAFFVAFSFAAVALRRRRWSVPGGLAAALAVATFPAVAVGFLELIDAWPHQPFFRPWNEFNGYWIGVAAATALVGLIAFAWTRFSFILGVSIAVVIAAAQLLTPAFDAAPSGDERTAAALVTGAVLVTIGVFLDAFARRRDAFWFHALGCLAAAAGLVFFTFEPNGDANRGWAPMLIVSVAMLLVSGPIRRATWAVYGVLGFYAAVLHYLNDALKERRWAFALAALGLGLSIFLFGGVVHRYSRPWARRFVRQPPPIF